MTLQIAPPHTFCDSLALGRRVESITSTTPSFDMRPTPLHAGSYPLSYPSHPPTFRPVSSEGRGPPPMGYCYEPTMQGYSTTPSYPPVVVYYHSPYHHSSPPPPPPPPRPYRIYGSPHRRQQVLPPQSHRYPGSYTYESRRNDRYSSYEEHYSIIHSSTDHSSVSPLISRDDVRKRERCEEEQHEPLLRIVPSPIKKQRLFPPLNTPSVSPRAQCSPPCPKIVDEKDEAEEDSSCGETNAREQDSTNSTEESTPTTVPQMTEPIENTVESVTSIKETAKTAASWSALDEVGMERMQQPRLDDAGVSVAAFRRRFQAHCEHHEAALALKALRRAK